MTDPRNYRKPGGDTRLDFLSAVGFLDDAVADLGPTELAVIADSVELMAQAGLDVTTAEGATVAIAAGRRRLELLADPTPGNPVRPELSARPSWVYYLVNGDRMKIGHSVNPRGRTSTMGEYLAAVEPGGREVEGGRHAEFAHLRVTGEWFRLAPELTAHVERLREQHVIPADAQIHTGHRRTRYSRSRQGPGAGRCSVDEIVARFGIERGLVYQWRSRGFLTRYDDNGVDPDEVAHRLATRRPLKGPAS